MPKQFYVLNAGRVVYAPGHYDQEAAESVARNASEREPGKTFTVVQEMAAFYQPPKRRPARGGVINSITVFNDGRPPAVDVDQ